MTEPDLNFIVRQLDRLIADVRSLRDEVRVQGAMRDPVSNKVQSLSAARRFL
jgi:hypothetical protein